MTTHLYIAECAGLHTLGLTADVPARIAEIQRANTNIVTLCDTVPGGRELEALMRECFRPYHRYGEWFSLPNHWRTMLPRTREDIHTAVVLSIAQKLAELPGAADLATVAPADRWQIQHVLQIVLGEYARTMDFGMSPGVEDYAHAIRGWLEIGRTPGEFQREHETLLREAARRIGE